MKKVLFSLALASLVFTSCGGGAEKKEEPKKVQAPQKSADYEEEVEVPEEIEVVIEGNDQMKFNLSKIEVHEGQTVKLTLKHVGEMPLAAMGHNWTLLAQGVDMAEYAAEAAAASDEDYNPAAMSDKVIAHTKTLGGGEETTIEFTAPAKGTYKFICTFPGHYGMMNGDFIVK
tara:strand:- start:1659 stop:2177 length:519 start_codon:yes stop_codon:yes gene_type:complete